MKFLWVALIITLSFFNIQCSDKSKSNSKRYFVKGDPKTIVAGTSMKSDLAVDNMKLVDGFYAVEAEFFSELGESKNSDQIFAEQNGKALGQEASIEFDANDRYKFAEKDGKYYYLAPDSTYIVFVNTSSGLKVESITDLNDRPVKVDKNIQHVSLAKDKSSMSVMVYFGEEGSRTLLAITFAKEFSFTDTPRATGDYDFLAGKNIKLRWPSGKNVTLNICTPAMERYESVFRRLLGTWTQHISSTKFDLKILKNPPPFSDLNTQCIYLVKNYIEIDRQQAGGFMGGVLANVTNKIIDADMFYYEDELQKMGISLAQNSNASYMYPTFLHEIGHFLGIGHPEDVENPKKPTVMSYREDADVEYLFPHDIDSIIELYK